MKRPCESCGCKGECQRVGFISGSQAAEFSTSQWHKIFGLMMYHENRKEIIIPPAALKAAVADLKGLNVTIQFSDEKGIIVRRLNDAEVRAMGDKR